MTIQQLASQYQLTEPEIQATIAAVKALPCSLTDLLEAITQAQRTDISPVRQLEARGKLVILGAAQFIPKTPINYET